MIANVVRAALKTIFSNRVYADTFIQVNGSLSQLPAARFVIVSSVNDATVCGTDDQSTDDTRVQLDIAAPDFDTRETKIEEVIEAMQDLEPPCRRDGLSRIYDDQTKTYRATMDFIFEPSSEITS